MKPLRITTYTFVIVLLTACSGGATPLPPTPNPDAVQTAVAQLQTSLTQTAEVAATFTPTPTEIPTPIPTATPSSLQAYESTQFGFAFLYPLDTIRKEWEPGGDIAFSTTIKYPSERSDPQPPVVSLTVFNNPESLPLMEWFKIHQGSEELRDLFAKVGVYQELEIDDHRAIIFRHRNMLPGTRLLIDTGQFITSIGMVEDQTGKIRETFAIVVASFKFGVPANQLVVDPTVQQEIQQILDTLGPPAD